MTGRAIEREDHRVPVEEPHAGVQVDGRNQFGVYLTTAEVAQRYRTAESTVRYWRTLDPPYGPRGALVGRRVLYPIAAIERFDKEIAAGDCGRSVRMSSNINT